MVPAIVRKRSAPPPLYRFQSVQRGPCRNALVRSQSKIIVPKRDDHFSHCRKCTAVLLALPARPALRRHDLLRTAFLHALGDCTDKRRSVRCLRTNIAHNLRPQLLSALCLLRPLCSLCYSFLRRLPRAFHSDTSKFSPQAPPCRSENDFKFISGRSAPSPNSAPDSPPAFQQRSHLPPTSHTFSPHKFTDTVALKITSLYQDPAGPPSQSRIPSSEARPPARSALNP